MRYGWEFKLLKAYPIRLVLSWWKHAAAGDPGRACTTGIPFACLLSAPVIKVISSRQWMVVCLSFCMSDVHTYASTHTAFIYPLAFQIRVCDCLHFVRNIFKWREPAFSSWDCSSWGVKRFFLVLWQGGEGASLRKVTVKIVLHTRNC